VRIRWRGWIPGNGNSAREAILASLLLIAVPAFISVGILVPHREIVDANTYPWSSIGKIGTRGQTCTGVVVGANQVLTAAHCVYNKAAGRFRYTFYSAMLGVNTACIGLRRGT
jgi:hypothetical protein